MRRKLISALLAAIVIVSVTFAAFTLSSASAGTTKAANTYVRVCDNTGCRTYVYNDNGDLIQVIEEHN